MKRQAVSIPVGARDLPHVAAAVLRLRHELPDWTITDQIVAVVMEGEAPSTELSHRWTIAVLNERLAQNAAIRRLDALETLAR